MNTWRKSLRYGCRAFRLPAAMVFLILAYSLALPQTAPAATFTWGPTSAPAVNRAYHTVTQLPNGKILVAGGWNSTGGGTYLASAELYDPVATTWSPTGGMAAARYNHTATLLPNGKVLVVGGFNNSNGYLASAELYDPATGAWSPAASMASVRAYHTATLLGNGLVLVAGGINGQVGVYWDTSELYNPGANTWTGVAGPMLRGRAYHTATLLQNGQVLVAGGQGTAGTLPIAELYTPGGGWTAINSFMAAARQFHTATLLPNGQVLLAGGNGSTFFLPSAELYDPATGTCTATGSLATGRYNHTATLLANGLVLVAGGGGTWRQLDQRRTLRSGYRAPGPPPAPCRQPGLTTRPPCCPTARSWWRGAMLLRAGERRALRFPPRGPGAPPAPWPLPG